jgi:hypothetical protein
MRGLKPIYRLCDHNRIVNWPVGLEDSRLFSNRSMAGTFISSCGLNIACRMQPIHNKYVMTMN